MTATDTRTATVVIFANEDGTFSTSTNFTNANGRLLGFPREVAHHAGPGARAEAVARVEALYSAAMKAHDGAVVIRDTCGILSVTEADGLFGDLD